MKRNFQSLITISVGFLLLLTSSLALAQGVSPTEAMSVGNQSYEAGQYAEAIEIYESIVAAGVQNSALYYNLGNAYFKQGDLGRAILNYRRAQSLAPRDADIAANLGVARGQTLDKLEADEGPLTNLVQVAEQWLTLDEASMLALLLWLTVSFFAIVAILSVRLRRISLWIIGVLGLLLIVGLFSMANRYYVQQTSPLAVIVVEEVDVTSGPGTGQQYLVEFNLHTGAEVRLLESRPGWQRVALPGNDFQGWVPAEAVVPIKAGVQ
jgi:tetratricopeptide (TPR) repeat protein